MINEALEHPSYSGSAQPLIEAILGGGFNLPPELRDLSNLVKQHQSLNGETSMPKEVNGASTSRPRKNERRNIWQDEGLDMSRLKIKDHSDEAITSVSGAEIPNHLRDSILRLVETQAIEAEEQARALAEAQGGSSRGTWELDGEDEDEIRRVRVTGEGDASGDEDTQGDTDKIVDKTRRPPKEPVYDPEVQMKLELAYLTNPAIFDRDSATRKSDGRLKLKERTNMDDSQLEGWRVMLDRNPHKEAILGRHQVIPPEYQIYLPKPGSGKGGRGGGNKGKGREDGTSREDSMDRRDGDSSRGGSSGRGGGGGGSGRGGGSGTGGRGGRGGRGGGGGGGGGDGGRGRGQNKGSRGHSNAARTRGHDKKMSRMGATL